MTTRSPAHPATRCPACGSETEGLQKTCISKAGWITFGVMLVFCLPLCWIGLLMKEEYRVCAACGKKLDEA